MPLKTSGLDIYRGLTVRSKRACNHTSRHHVRAAVAPLMLKTNEVLPHVEGMDAVAHEIVDKLKRDVHPRTHRIPEFENKMFLWSMESISLMLLNKRFGETNIWPISP